MQTSWMIVVVGARCKKVEEIFTKEFNPSAAIDPRHCHASVSADYQHQKPFPVVVPSSIFKELPVGIAGLLRYYYFYFFWPIPQSVCPKYILDTWGLVLQRDLG